MSRGVTLVASDAGWAATAAAWSARIVAVLGGEVHHIGSTSVPGLVAKPIVDLMPVVDGLARVDARRAALEALGLEWRGEHGIAGRRYLRRDDLHVHVFAAGHPEIARHLAFRDALRARPELAAAYAADKRALAARFADDRDAYQAGKSPFIEGVLRELLG